MSTRSVSVVALTALCCYLIADWPGGFVGLIAAVVLLRSPSHGRVAVGVAAVALLGFAAISSLVEAPADPSTSFTTDRPWAAAAARTSAVLVVAGLVAAVDRVRVESRTEAKEPTGP
jgi:hypothetical protein